MKNDTLTFYKMQGAGNDFVVLDNQNQSLSLNRIIELTPRLCDRKFGVGADGVLVLQPADGADYAMIYRNADGSDAGMCGNGGRCIARFAVERGFPDNHAFKVHDKIYHAEVQGENVSLAFPMSSKAHNLKVDGKNIIQLYTGTEHIVLPVDQSILENEAYLFTEGKKLRHHPQFQPAGTNVNFMSGKGPKNLELQTYERGVENLTLACGTGAIASALAWHHLQDSTGKSNEYDIQVKGGDLKVHFDYSKDQKTYSNIKLEGPAHFVFEGHYYL